MSLIEFTDDEKTFVAAWAQWELGSADWGISVLGLVSAYRAETVGGRDPTPRALLRHYLGDMPEGPSDEDLDDILKTAGQRI